MKEDLTSPRINIEGLQPRFDAYCKKAMGNAAYDLVRKETILFGREVPVCCILFEEMLPDEGYEDEYKYEEERPHTTDYKAGDQMLKVTDDRLDEIIHRLSKRNREVVILSFAFKYTNAQIADTLGISRTAVKSAKARAFREIRKMLAES